MASSDSDLDATCDVFSKSPVFTISEFDELRKHEKDSVPLQTSWTFWLDQMIPGSSAAQYASTLKKIYTISTVQDFWAVFNNIPSADRIQVRYSYHLMKEQVPPLWEDPYNQHGGTWRFRCHKQDTSLVWQELLLATIGEQFSDCMADGDSVCGVTVNIRDRDDLIQIWNVSAAHSSMSKILLKVSRLLPDVKFNTVFYKAHMTHHAYEGDKHASKKLA